MGIDPMRDDPMAVIADVAPAEPGPADVYLVVVDGTPVDACMWDGKTEFAHPSGGELVKASDWRGPAYVGPPEDPAAAAQRTQAERLQALRRQLTDDLAAVDTATIAQLRTIVRHVIRAERILIRMALAEAAEDEPTE